MSWITAARPPIGLAGLGDRSGLPAAEPHRSRRCAPTGPTRHVAFGAAFARKLGRGGGRRAPHARGSVGMGLAVEQCLEHQKELFRKHGRSPRGLMLCRGAPRKIRSTKCESHRHGDAAAQGLQYAIRKITG
ncbi:hypothetical protein CEE96_11740, partial [Lactobacillus crispatus]